MHKKRVKKYFQEAPASPQKKVWDENEERNKKNDTRIKNVFNGRKWFISHVRGTGETDQNEMRVSNF